MFRKPDVPLLGRSGDIPGLIKALGYRKDESAQVGAAKALGDTGDQRAIGPLAAWVRQARYHDDRVAAIGSIGKIGGPAAADALLELFANPPGDAAGTLLELFANPPGDAAGTLLAAEAVRVSAAKALGEAGDQRAIGPLQTWLYQTGSDEDRAVATGSIGQIGGPAAVGLLLELLPDARFGDNAAAALGSTGDPQAATALLQLLTGSSVHLQPVAIALGRLGDSRAVTPLCELLSEKLKAGDNTDMSSIAVALGNLVIGTRYRSCAKCSSWPMPGWPTTVMAKEPTTG